MIDNFKFILLSLIFVSFNIIFAEEKVYVLTQEAFERVLQKSGDAHLNKEQMEQAYIDYKNNTRERNLAETRSNMMLQLLIFLGLAIDTKKFMTN